MTMLQLAFLRARRSSFRVRRCALLSWLMLATWCTLAAAMFSDVFMWTHKNSDVVSSFVEIRTQSGTTMRLSSGHFLFEKGDLVAADCKGW